MIDTVFGIKVRMSGLSINRYRPIIGRLLDADNRPLPYRCTSSKMAAKRKRTNKRIAIKMLHTMSPSTWT